MVCENLEYCLEYSVRNRLLTLYFFDTLQSEWLANILAADY